MAQCPKCKAVETLQFAGQTLLPCRKFRQVDSKYITIAVQTSPAGYTAELLLDHCPAEKKEVLDRLDFAIKEFREMKMQPSLERALRHKEILKA